MSDHQLPPCRYRALPAVHHNGRDRYPCSHPLVARPNPTELVVAQQCLECSYVGFEMSTAPTRYHVTTISQPTIDEFAARVAICKACEVRQDNYCPPSGGSCSLAQKLGKGGFGCPMGKFGVIERG